MSQTVANLMTRDPFAVRAEHTLYDAHNLMKEKNVRHIPVIDSNGVLQGMLTQKIMMTKVLAIMGAYGANALIAHEKDTQVKDLMAIDFACVTPSQPLHEVVAFFVQGRHGCMPVVDAHSKLVGILTSADFVRLAAALLEKP
ncbi:HPP family protein [Pseudoalteromonas sp.]|uniref:CBS domain-containing protein n=1 Tax=Pseudoalteromonas sp. TaxID=53249 RepID=UPI00356A5246